LKQENRLGADYYCHIEMTSAQNKYISAPTSFAAWDLIELNDPSTWLFVPTRSGGPIRWLLGWLQAMTRSILGWWSAI
jgi:hypothetical protein